MMKIINPFGGIFGSYRLLYSVKHRGERFQIDLRNLFYNETKAQTLQ